MNCLVLHQTPLNDAGYLCQHAREPFFNAWNFSFEFSHFGLGVTPQVRHPERSEGSLVDWFWTKFRRSFTAFRMTLARFERITNIVIHSVGSYKILEKVKKLSKWCWIIAIVMDSWKIWYSWTALFLNPTIFCNFSARLESITPAFASKLKMSSELWGMPKCSLLIKVH